MSEEYKEPQQPSKEETDKMDEIIGFLETDPRRAFELYSKTNTRVRELLTVFDANDYMDPKDPNIEINLILAYITALANGNEFALKWIRKKCNRETLSKINDIS